MKKVTTGLERLLSEPHKYIKGNRIGMVVNQRGAIFEMGRGYDASELAPVFVDMEPVIRRVCGGNP